MLTDAAGWTRLLWLAMEYTPTLVSFWRPQPSDPQASADDDAGEWWSTGGGQSVWEWV